MEKTIKHLYHHSEFNVKELHSKKTAQGLTVALVIPTLNEEKTIGKILDMVRNKHSQLFTDLLDEIVVVDSGSTDKTRQEVEKRGIKFILSSEVPPLTPLAKGKGENLYKSLLSTASDIIVWTEADSQKPDPAHITGLLGPLVYFPDKYVFSKAVFLRKTFIPHQRKTQQGGRVTELMARPALNLLFPELKHIIQPYNGNVAVFRKALRGATFPSAYGVDLSLLIDVAMKHSPEKIAQVFCNSFVQEGQTLQQLGKMSFQALRTVIQKAEQYGKIATRHDMPSNLTQMTVSDNYKVENVCHTLAEVNRTYL